MKILMDSFTNSCQIISYPLISILFASPQPGRIAQSIVHLTEEPEVPGQIPRPEHNI